MSGRPFPLRFVDHLSVDMGALKGNHLMHWVASSMNLDSRVHK